MRVWLKVLWVGSVATLILCAFSVLCVFLAAKYWSGDQVGTMGSIGDAFGVVAALFSGLGFVGLAAALVFDSQKRSEDLEDRRRYRVPFIVPSIEEDRAEIDRAERLRKDLKVDVRLAVNLKNLTEEPALDLSLSGRVPGSWGDVGVKAEIGDHPMGPKEEREGYITLQFEGEWAESMIRAFKAQSSPLECLISARCVSLSGTAWVSNVKYKLGVDDADFGDLDNILDKQSDYSISPRNPEAGELGKSEVLYLVAQAVPGSWSYKSET